MLKKAYLMFLKWTSLKRIFPKRMLFSLDLSDYAHSMITCLFVIGNEPIDLHFLSRPISRRMKEGEETILECIPSGEGELRVEWMKDGRKIDDHKGIQRVTN